MKRLFLLLLLLNVGLFAWGYQREQAVARHARHVRPDVGDLRLLTERQPPAPPEPATDSALQAVSATEAQTLAEPPQAPSLFSGEEDEPEPPVATAQQPPEVPDSGVTPGDEAIEEGMAEIEQPVPFADGRYAETEPEVAVSDEETESPPPGAQRETPPEQAADATPPAPEMVPEMLPEAEPPVPAPVCYRLGPLTEAASAEGLLGHLAQLDITAAVQSETIEKAKGYWVMVPAQPSYAQARQMLQALKQAGVNDLWLFPKGKYKNAISIGLYSRLSNARAARQRALKKGVVTEVIARLVKVEQYWLEFQSRRRPPVAEESILALQEAYPEEEFAVAPCSTVVTE